MPPIRITTRLESETLTLPELKGLIGKVVEIRVREAAVPAARKPEVTLEEVRAMLAKLPGSLTADIIAERDER